MEANNIEVKHPKDFLVLAIYELIGTTILTIAMNFAAGRPDIIASGIFVAIVLTFKISGSHFNAGISLGTYILNGQWRA